LKLTKPGQLPRIWESLDLAGSLRRLVDMAALSLSSGKPLILLSAM
jgi:hypothetical protein